MKTRLIYKDLDGTYKWREVEEITDVQPTAEELRQAKLAEIESLQIELTKSDYMVIKCWEAEKLGLPLPYTAEEIHAIKQPLRDRINELEQELEQ